MFAIDYQILIASVLLFVGILSSKLSPRLGLPLLVVFLLVGMFAGEDGLGLSFDNAGVAHALGTLALAMILFDGGLQTSFSSIKLVWKPASVLATLGVAITAGVTGFAAAHILGVPPMVGFLIGAIVGSTDAAAVFSILRNAGLYLSPRLKATLEIESASNDPMAIFLTVGILELLTHQMEPGWDLAALFIMQMGIGTLVGLSIGWLAVKLINRITLGAPGLYPVLVAVCGFLTFGASASLGGSGFLATFIAGVFIGNSRFVLKRATFMFHDGLAWMSQIAMFVMLGLLVNPKSLLDVWAEGLLIAAVLIFVSRPLAVAPFMAMAGFNRREIGLLSWVGLRGSVPGIAIGICIAVILLPMLQVLDLMASVLFGVVLMVVTGCLRPGELQRAIRWDVILLLGSIVCFSVAMQSTGLARGLAVDLLQSLQGWPNYLVLMVVFLLAQLFTETLTNGATVVLLIPIATELAKGLALPPMAFIYAILFAASLSFLTPIGYQCNLMVMGPGRYRFFDMTRYGAPLTIGLTLLTPWLICRHFGL